MRTAAITVDRRFVPAGMDRYRHQVLMGGDAFVARYQQRESNERLREVSKAQRRSVALVLPVYRKRYPDRAKAMVRA